MLDNDSVFIAVLVMGSVLLSAAFLLAYGWWESRDLRRADRACEVCGSPDHCTPDTDCPMAFLAGVEDAPEMEAA